MKRFCDDAFNLPTRHHEVQPIKMFSNKIANAIVRKQMNTRDRLHTIQQVSQRLELPKSTLRFWERNFASMLTPLRTTGGQRRYTNAHIGLLERIKGMREAGLSLPEIRRRLELQVNPGCVDTNQIELLANRLGKLVRNEIYRFYNVHSDHFWFDPLNPHRADVSAETHNK